MYRKMKWIAPVAALALIVGFQLKAKGQDAPTTAPAGTATVNVTVVDGDNKPVSGVKVSLLPPRAKKGKKSAAAAADGTAAAPTKPAKVVPIASGTTDDDGKVALTGIADGSYQLQARSKTAGAGKGTVTVSGGQDAAVSITMMPRATPGGATTQPAAGQ
jgi:protocatechuate 3,4-dioxygenase beta subunit